MFAKRFSVFEILRVILGAVAWLFLLGVDLLAGTHLGTIQLMFLLAPLVVVPLGFLLGRAIAGDHDNADERWARLLLYCEPVAAALVVGSFWLPRNVEAALLTIPWLLVCVLKGVLEVFRFSRHRERRAENFCFLASLLYLPVGAAGLVTSRAGATPLGFEEPILLLFAVHYHFSGFAAPLLAGLLGRRLGQFQGSSCGLSPGWYRTFRLVAAGVVTGPLLLALGSQPPQEGG